MTNTPKAHTAPVSKIERPKDLTEVFSLYLKSAAPITPVLAYVLQLEHALAECYRLSGADPDGNEDWRLCPDAVEEVRRLREDYDALTDRAPLHGDSSPTPGDSFRGKNA